MKGDSQPYTIDVKTFLKHTSVGQSIVWPSNQTCIKVGKKTLTIPNGKEGGETKHAPARQTDATQTRDTSVTGR
ncbi:MAG TPA: hypothetical protein VN377_00845 [Candidatus Thermoplasmatota archaeon]|nr:hypothetical protein [Candidatus Thermoplasmatota archaeon]